MINRAAIIINIKPPMLEWINTAFSHDKMPSVDIENANSDTTIFLVDEELADDAANFTSWLKENWRALFEEQLDSWYTDTTMWPQDLSYKMFTNWFDIQIHSMVTDTVDYPIEEDDF